MRNDSIYLTERSLIRFFLFLAVLAFLSGSGFVIAKTISTSVTAANDRQLSYRSVSVNTEDTLWSIAKENYTQEWGTLSDYLEEIMRCNALTSEDITAGSSLVVPVYLSSDNIETALFSANKAESANE